MKLHELRREIESDALLEKEQLQKENVQMKAEHEKEIKELTRQIEELTNDCKALANRCWVTAGMPSGSTFCNYCSLSRYVCPHAKSEDEKITYAKHMRKIFDGNFPIMNDRKEK